MGFPGGSGEDPTCQAADVGSISGSGRSPGMATHSSILAWETPWTEDPILEGYSPWGHKRVRHDLATKQQ